MLNILIVGASGYTGAELVNYMYHHAFAKIDKLLVSKNSLDVGKSFSDIYQKYVNIINLKFESISNFDFSNKKIDAVFLATDHLISYSLVPLFLSYGCVVFDLSGAYRIKNNNIYPEYYGFIHKNEDILKKSVYGLAEWNCEAIRESNFISVPGCYATCIQLSLKPLIESNILSQEYIPIINAISGVSGAGRKPSFINSFCEISLQPYNIFTHRHTPEIIENLGISVIFIPNLGSFSRGIIATITCKLTANIKWIDVYNIFLNFYKNKPLIRLYKNCFPSIQSVEKSPFCDIGFIIKDNYIIIVTAEDNLLKGAATQAVQCFNIRFGFSETESII